VKRIGALKVSSRDQTHPSRRLILVPFTSDLLSFLLVLGSVGVIVFAAFTVYLVYSPLPWVDQWAFLQELIGNYGHYSAAMLWHQYNDHRIPLPKLFYLVDLYCFHGTNVFLLSFIFCLQLLHLGALAVVFRRIGEFKGALWRTSIALAATCLFALRQAENLWFGSDLPFPLVWLGATVAFGGAGLYRLSLDRGINGIRFVVLACAGAFVASLSLTNGLLLWPMLVMILLIWRVPVRVVSAVAALGGLLCVAWIPGYHRVSSPQGLDLLQIAHFFLLLYGSSWTCVSENFGMILAALVIPFAIGSYLWVLWRRGADRLATVLLSIAAFSVAGSFLTAAGRAVLGLEYARTDRYQTGAMLLWCSVFVLVLRKASSLSNRTVLLALQVAFVAVLLAAAKISPFVAAGARVEADGRRAAAVALQSGVKDWSVISYVTTPPRNGDDLMAICDFLRAHHWSIFGDGERYPLGRKLTRYYRVVPASECRGYVEAVKPIRDYRLPGFAFSGWASTDGGTSAAAVVLADTSGRLIGFGESGFRRTDVPYLVPAVKSMNTGYRGYVPADLQATEAMPFAILQDGLSACPLTTTPLHFDWQELAYSGPKPTGATLTMTVRRGTPLLKIETIGNDLPVGRHEPLILPGDRPLTVTGWILSPDSQLGSGVDLVIDDVPIAAQYGFKRPDVAKAVRVPGAISCGFRGILPKLPSGDHKIGVRIIERNQLRYFQGYSIKVTVR